MSSDAGKHRSPVDAVSPQSRACNHRKRKNPRLGMNAKITWEWAYHVRGMARFQLGEFDAAAQDFATAEASSPGTIAYRAKRILAQARSRVTGARG
jgi:hypothetical protein